MEDLDALADSTLSKVKYLWEPQKPNAFKDSTRALDDTKFNLQPKAKENKLEASISSSKIYDNNQLEAPPLKAAKRAPNSSIGKGWFNLEPIEFTEQVKRDLKVIKLRGHLDPKKFYKNPDKAGKVLGIGTIVESPFEYTSSRLTKKERKQTLLDEIMSDKQTTSYAKRTFLKIQETKSKKRKIFAKKGGGSGKKTKRLRADKG